MKNVLLCLAFASAIAIGTEVKASILIQYSEVGSDLVLEWSGSLNVNNPAATTSGPLIGLGNQSAGTRNPIFYSAPSGFDVIATFNNVTASADTFWTSVLFADYSGNSAVGDNFMFRYNTASNSVETWGNAPYIAGEVISGTATFGGHSIASTGIIDWNVDLGNGDSITIQAKDAVVPEPSTYLTFVGLMSCFGLTGWWRKRRQAA